MRMGKSNVMEGRRLLALKMLIGLIGSFCCHLAWLTYLMSTKTWKRPMPRRNRELKLDNEVAI